MLPPQMASKLSSPAIPDRSDHRKDSAHMQHLELRQSQCPLRPAQSRLFNWAGPTLLLYFCIGGNESRYESRYESPKQTNSRANGSTGLPEDIEAPSAASKTPACKTCFVTAACIVASVKAPAVSYVAASANIHTAPLRRNANNAGTNSRLPAIHCNI